MVGKNSMGRKLSEQRRFPLTRTALHVSGIPERYWIASLLPIEDSPYKENLKRYLSKVHIYVEKGRGLFLHGDFETGKTFAAVAIGKEVLRRGGTIYFLKARDILRVVYDGEETEDGSNLIRNQIKKVDLLILDDLGAEGFDPKKFGGAELEGIIRDRYDARCPIIVTSNQSPKQLEEKYTKAFVNIVKRTVDVLCVKTTQWKGKKHGR